MVIEMIKVIRIKENKDELINKVQKMLNYQLGRGEEYATVDDIKVLGKTKSGKTRLRVLYSVSVRIPVGRDPETGIEEYEYDDEFRTTDLDI